jgi:hypothetical protein
MMQDHIKHQNFVSQIPFNGQPTFSDQEHSNLANLKPENNLLWTRYRCLVFLKIIINLDFTYYNANTVDQNYILNYRYFVRIQSTSSKWLEGKYGGERLF